MARVFQVGGERNLSLTGAEWTGTAGGGSGITISTAVTRGSRYSHKCDVPGGGNRYAYTYFRTADSNVNTYAKFDWWLDNTNFGGNQPVIFEFLNAAGNRNAQVQFTSNNSTLLLLSAADAVIATGPVITTGQWYQIEVSLIYAASYSTAELKVNGISYGSGVAGSATSNHASALLWGATQSSASGTATMYFDNIIINDSTGSAETSWVGDQRLIQAHPVAMGDAVTDTGASPYLWQTSGGGVASGDLTNWNRVDEVAYDDATTYSRANLAQHYLDIYAVETRATIGEISDQDTITCFNVNGRMGGTGTTSRPFRYFFQYDSSGTGAVYSGDLEANANTWFTGDVNDVPGVLLHPIYPTGKKGGAIDTAEIGIYENDGTSRPVYCSANWLEITYKPHRSDLAIQGVG